MASNNYIPWELKHKNVFLIYTPDEVPERGIMARLLVESSCEGKLTGAFRWMLKSSEPVKAEFNLKLVSSYESEDNYTLTYCVKPEDLELRPNTSTGPWEDLADLIAEERISVTKDGEDASKELIGMLNNIVWLSKSLKKNFFFLNAKP
jgi:hypothetical protein